MTKRDRLIVVSIAWLGMCSYIASCASAPPSLSPRGAAAFQAKRAVAVLDVIRDFAIGANELTPPVLSTEDTRKVVLFHQSAVKTIRAVPDGWKSVTLQAIDQLKADLPADKWKRLAPYVALLTVIIQEVP